MEKFQLERTSGQWMIFTVSSKANLKSVLLHFGNMFSSVPFVLAVRMKGMHDYLQGFLQKISYKEHRCTRITCADLNVLALLTVQKGGYTKFCCF